MPRPVPGLFLAVAALLLALPGFAQNYGPQPGFQPGPYQPAPFQQPGAYQQPGPYQQPGAYQQPNAYQQPGPYQPNPSYQPGPMPQPSQPGGGPSLVGTWSGQSNGPSGTGLQADSFSPDGRFVSVVRLPNGFLARLWGNYRTAPAGPNQLRVESQLQGWLPREICQQPAGGQPQCQPFQLPTTDTSLVTFGSPDQRQTVSETSEGSPLNSMRDNQPALLQAQAPQRWLTIMQPSAASPTGPVAANPRPYASPAPAAGRSGCYNDDIQRSVCKYSGRLIQSGGCLKCVD